MASNDELLEEFFVDPFLLFDQNQDHIFDLVIRLVEIPLIDYLHKVASQRICELSAKVIPQFSNLEDCTTRLTATLELSGDMGFNFLTVGEYINPTSPSDAAKTKYGENQSKTGNMLILCEIKREGEYKVYLSSLGSIFHALPEGIREKLVIRLILRTDIFVYFYQMALIKTIDIKRELETVLSETTAIRRTPNVKKFLELVLSNSEIKLDLFRVSLGL